MVNGAHQPLISVLYSCAAVYDCASVDRPGNPTLPRLILRELSGDIVEFGAITELGQGFFFLCMFFALDIKGSHISVINVSEANKE